MRWISAITFVVLFALILLSSTLSSSFQGGNYSAKLYYSISIQAPSHQPAILVTRVPYSLKYDALFQPEAMEVGKTATSSIIGRSTSANITPIPPITHASMKFPSLGRLITSPSIGKNVFNLTNNMTSLNFVNKMIAQQTRNSTIPTIVNSSFKVLSP